MKISFESAGYKLAGNLFVAVEPKRLALLFIQGWQGHENVSVAERLAGLGFTSLTYAMRGHGESEGELADFSRADFLDDAVTAYDYLLAQVAPGTRIAVVGSSFGSYTGVLLTTRRPVAALSLRVPASYPDEGFDEPQAAQNGASGRREWRNRRLNYNENRAFAALHAFAGRVQIVEAEQDEQVPHQAPQNYADAVADKTKLDYAVMQGAPHSLVNEQLAAEYERLLVNWVVGQ